MGATLAEKIIARAAGRESVSPGDVVTAKVDLAMMHDAGGPRRVKPMLEELDARIWDPEKVVVISDHMVPAVDAVSAGVLQLTRDWVAEQGIPHFHDMQGICHVVLPERGHLKPGMFVVGGDSHSTTGGAFGAFMFGVGATDLAGVLVTGETWIKVPETIRIEWSGSLGQGVSAKDINLALCARLGMDGGRYQAIEYTGSLVNALPMQERMTLANMAAELQAQAGLIAPDQTTADYLAKCGCSDVDLETWQPDPDAAVAETHHFDADTLAPQVAAPHSPANAAAVDEHEGTPINQAYIGSCTGAKLTDLHMAAEVLKGRKVAPGVRLLVAPASRNEMTVAMADGTMAALSEAGAIVMPSGCGACAGFGPGVLTDNEVCISSTSRNFQGRMGANTARVYLGSPYTVAAAAIAGEVKDPRHFLSEGSS